MPRIFEVRVAAHGGAPKQPRKPSAWVQARQGSGRQLFGEAIGGEMASGSGETIIVPRNFKLLEELEKAEKGNTDMSVSYGLVQSDDISLSDWQCTILGPINSQLENRIVSLLVTHCPHARKNAQQRMPSMGRPPSLRLLHPSLPCRCHADKGIRTSRPR